MSEEKKSIYYAKNLYSEIEYNNRNRNKIE